MATAELKAKISLDNSSFEKGLRAVRRDISSLNRAITSVASAAAKVAGALAALSTAALVKGVKDALALGDSLDELSKRTGASAGQLLILQEAFRQTGVGAEGVGPAINRMQKALEGVNEEGEPTNKMFGRLGLNIDALKKMKPVEQFEAIGAAIRNLESPSERAAAAMGIFGKSGASMLPLMMDQGAMGGAKGAVGGQADIMDRSAEAFGKVNDALGSIWTRFQGLFVGIAEKMLPAFQEAVALIESLDLTGLGARIGNAMQSGVNILVNAFKTGQLSELVGLALKAGFMIAMDYLLRAIRGVVSVMAEAFGQVMAAIFNMDFFSALVNGFIVAANKMGIAFVDAMEAPLKWMVGKINSILTPVRKMMGKEALTNEQAWAETFGGTGDDMRAEMRKNIEEADVKLGDALLGLSGKGIIDPAAIKAAFSQGFDAETIFSGMSEEAKKALGDLAAQLNIPISKVAEAAAAQMPKGKLAPEEGAFKGIAKTEAASTLERIGAVMGGGTGNQAIAYARKTSEGVSKIVTSLKDIASNITGYKQPAAVYGS